MTRQRSPIVRGLGAKAAAAVCAFGLIATSSPAAAAPTPPPTAPPAEPRIQPDDLAKAPYMGWSSFSMEVYSPLGAGWITSEQIVAQSDAMHEKLQRFGYEYINLDAGWNDWSDEYGRPKPSAKAWGDEAGFLEVIDHIHDNGQKIGVYLVPGIQKSVYDADLPIFGTDGHCTTKDVVTLPLRTADSWGGAWDMDFDNVNGCAKAYVKSQVDRLDEWGIDYLKFDSVSPGSGMPNSADQRDEVALWSKLLHEKGIWFELSWALDPAYIADWRKYADGFRVDWDVEAYATGSHMVNWEKLPALLTKAETWWRLSGPGGFGDYDSLLVGNGAMDGITKDERRSFATLWAIQASPLYSGDDLTQLDKYGIELLTNPEVIAINQAGRPARPVGTGGKHQVWYTLNDDGSYTVAFFNLGVTDANIKASWQDIGLGAGTAKVRDVWARKNVGSFTDSYTAKLVPPHGVHLVTLTPTSTTSRDLNDDNARIGYSGAWHRNGGDESAATTQNLAVSVKPAGTEVTQPSDTTTRITKLNNTDASIQYQGGWSRNGPGRNLGDYEDDVHFTEANGNSFTVPFTGTGVKYITEKDVSQGTVDVYLDGEKVATVDTGLPDGSPRESQVAVYSVSDLVDGPHTLRVVKTGGSYMLLDAIEIQQSNLLTPNAVAVEKWNAPDVSVALSRGIDELASLTRGDTKLVEGTDYTIDGASIMLKGSYLSGLPEGDQKIAFTFAGDRFDDIHTGTGAKDWTDLTFTGTAVSWIAPTAPDQGKVNVFVDGKFVKTVDTHADARHTGQTLVKVTGLKRGTHRIVIQNASDGVIRSDGFTYTG